MDNQNNIKIFVFVIVLLVVGVVVTAFLRSGPSSSGAVVPGQYDAFATCLKDSGATFYGAFWCPHCKAEKALFGTSVSKLPYVECSTADAAGQTQICIDKHITGYPTWEFKDGSRLTGEIPLQQLADKTSCVLPGGTATPAAPVNTGASSPAVPAK